MSSSEVDAAMPSPTEITVAQLSRLVGLPGTPALVDVRADDEFAANPCLIPSAQRHPSTSIEDWCARYAGQSLVVVCQSGGTASQAVAARLRRDGLDAQILEGGHDAWRELRQPLVLAAKIPPRDYEGRTVWVTRARPKVVRVACPWLIQRFIDPNAIILIVPPSQVAGVATHATATPFDADGAFWSDRGEKTTFDVMVEEFGLDIEPLRRLAHIVRGADTGRFDLTPQSAGLLATCLGYSRMYRDDAAQLIAAMPQFDALYRWARDAVDERHG
jgi:rhodanese-related sulfurtransferase